MQLYAPTHQDSSRFDGKVSHVPANTPGQLKVQWSSIAMSARNYISSKFKGQTSLCPPETISAQSSKDKCRYAHQKLYQLKVQWSNVAMSARNYISIEFNGISLLYGDFQALSGSRTGIGPHRRFGDKCIE